MHVHQMSQLVVGILAGGGGLVILLVCLYECLKSKTLFPLARLPWVWALFGIAIGIERLSRTFDWPHQNSLAGSLIACLPLLAPSICLIWMSILKRADKKAKADMGITALGEHKA